MLHIAPSNLAVAPQDALRAHRRKRRYELAGVYRATASLVLFYETPQQTPVKAAYGNLT